MRAHRAHALGRRVAEQVRDRPEATGSQACRALLVALVAVMLVAAPASASVLKIGNFETGDLSQWNATQVCNATAYSSTSEPAWPAPDQGTYAMRLNVENNDAWTGTAMDCNAASGTPRGQVFGSRTQGSGAPPLGGDYWYTFSWYDPTNGGVPAITGSNWYVVQQDFGPPFTGSPPVAIDLKDANSDGTNEFKVDVCHDGCTTVTTVLNGPTVRKEHWYRIKVHKVMSTSDATGSIEIWIDGVKQRFTNSSTVYNTRTLHANCTCTSADGYSAYLNSYHAAGLGTITTYFDAFKSGTTRADAT